MLEFFRIYSGMDLLIICVAFIIVILFALTIHEFAHSYVAMTQGDYTSRYFGRLSLNPFKHIDPIGFLCLILLGFGWAKPVPINSTKFKNYKKGLFLTSIAGVCANFICSFLCAGLLVLCFKNTNISELSNLSYIKQFLFYLFSLGASINLGLAVFNLLPIPPLDGFNALCSFTKGTNRFVEFLKRYGYILLLILLIFNVIDYLFGLVYGVVLPAFLSFWHLIF